MYVCVSMISITRTFYFYQYIFNFYLNCFFFSFCFNLKLHAMYELTCVVCFLFYYLNYYHFIILFVLFAVKIWRAFFQSMLIPFQINVQICKIFILFHILSLSFWWCICSYFNILLVWIISGTSIILIVFLFIIFDIYAYIAHRDWRSFRWNFCFYCFFSGLIKINSPFDLSCLLFIVGFYDIFFTVEPAVSFCKKRNSSSLDRQTMYGRLINMSLETVWGTIKIYSMKMDVLGENRSILVSFLTS